MLDFSKVKKIILIPYSHIYYYLEGENKKYLSNHRSVTNFVSEWYFLKNDCREEHIPYHWKKEYLKNIDDNNGYLNMGAKIHNYIANNTLYEQFKWISDELPKDIKGRHEFAMFSNNNIINLVGSCDLINIENDKVVIYEFKNSWNLKKQKELQEKGKKQLFFYGYLAYQTFEELTQDTKITLKLMIFEHPTKSVLKYEYEVNLKDIIKELNEINTLFKAKQELLKEEKEKFANRFKVESIEPTLIELAHYRNDLDFQLKLKQYQNLEKEAKELIKNQIIDKPNVIKYIAKEEDKIFGYKIAEYYTTDNKEFNNLLCEKIKELTPEAEKIIKELSEKAQKHHYRFNWTEEV